MTAPLPLPRLRLIRPATVEAAIAARAECPQHEILAGGTDLLVNLRRGLLAPPALIDITGIAELAQIRTTGDRTRIGALVPLARLAEDPSVLSRHAALHQAAASVAAPGHRRLATVGGNLCLQTRCIYFNQSAWWRAANGACLKSGGEVCHVAPEGTRCHAAFSGDVAPALIALDAEIEIAGPAGRRRVACNDLYHEEGRAHLRLGADELVTAIEVPTSTARSGYLKERIRRSFDFPLAGVAIACRTEGGGLRALRIAVTGTNSRPLLIDGTDAFLGRAVDESVLAAAEKLVAKQVRPMRTTLFPANHRRSLAAALARRLLGTLAAPDAAAPGAPRGESA
jgi:4-hydroxybenzoyl-CoA reductase subunit beta